MMYLISNIHGAFAIKNGRVIIKKPFSQDPELIAENFIRKETEVLDEEKQVLDELVNSNNKEIFVEDTSKYRALGLDVKFTKGNPNLDVFMMGEQLGIPQEATRKILRKVNIALSSAKLRDLEKDQLILQAVNSLDELLDSANLLNERLREWYGLYFPELDHLVDGNEVFTRLVAEKGGKENFNGKLGLDDKHAKKITSSIPNSLGGEFTEVDLAMVQSYARQNHNLYELKKQVEEYVDEQMQEIAPNLTHLVGGQLGARLIALAGSLKRLASLPAGTIQVLGAEDAFFRFLKSGRKPPKHGIIFQYPAIRGGKRNVRGKLARTLAAKIAIASRADAFEGDFIAPKLLKQFKKRMKALG